MAKKDMKAALGKSLQDEGDSVEKRFKSAEQAFGKRYTELSTGRSSEAQERVIRDSFTMPDFDYKLIEDIKNRCLKLGISLNKSESLRAGLHALSNLSDQELIKTVEGLTKVKTGRPPTE